MGSPDSFQAEMLNITTSPRQSTPCWLLSRAIGPSSSLHVLCLNLHEGYRKCVLKNCPLNKFWFNQNMVHNADGDKYFNAMMDYFRSEASHSSWRCECSIFSIFTLVEVIIINCSPQIVCVTQAAAPCSSHRGPQASLTLNTFLSDNPFLPIRLVQTNSTILY